MMQSEKGFFGRFRGTIVNYYLPTHPPIFTYVKTKIKVLVTEKWEDFPMNQFYQEHSTRTVKHANKRIVRNIATQYSLNGIPS